MRLTRFTPLAGAAIFSFIVLCWASCSGGQGEAANLSEEGTGAVVVANPCDCLTKGLSSGQKEFCRESKRDTQFLEAMRQCGVAEVGGVSAVTNFPDNGQYTMDTDQSKLEWMGSKMGAVEKGTIPIRSCTFTVEDNRLVSGELVVDMVGIQSTSQEGLAARELGKHLRSADFFDVSTYPTAAYTITSSKTDGRGNLSVQGKLNIKGQTKEVEAMMTFASADPVVVSVSLAFNRADFDVRFGSGSFFDNLGDDLISDEVNMRMALVENVSLRKGN
mgnify:CR=1 FL=1